MYNQNIISLLNGGMKNMKTIQLERRKVAYEISYYIFCLNVIMIKAFRMNDSFHDLFTSEHPFVHGGDFKYHNN